MANNDLAVTVLIRSFNDHDPSVVDDLVAPGYLQHSALAADGRDALRDLVAGLGPDVTYQNVRAFHDGDLVVTHGVYTGFGPDPLVGFDLFRVADGRLVEHWDALTAVVEETASGHTQTDGPTSVTEPESTEANRKIVTEFVDTILVRRDYSNLASYFAGDTYLQHNPGIPDGLAGLLSTLEAFARQGITMVYHQVHRVVAEGEFVFVQSEGTFGGEQYAFYDLFRVADGKIAEHWDVMHPVPADLPHDNGLF